MIPAIWKSVPDWMRMVSLQVNPILQGMPPLRLNAAPADPSEGLTYYDTVLHKMRTYDGSNWQNHW